MEVKVRLTIVNKPNAGTWKMKLFSNFSLLFAVLIIFALVLLISAKPIISEPNADLNWPRAQDPSSLKNFKPRNLELFGRRKRQSRNFMENVEQRFEVTSEP
ncbi:hypothetical protein Ddc_16349 [Ditylenchus destructor]|nr:hypothetical protein Ddc_16349 [Ditylenchus destructor]